MCRLRNDAFVALSKEKYKSVVWFSVEFQGIAYGMDLQGWWKER